MSNTMRSSFEGIKDVNPHRVSRVVGRVINEVITVDPMPTDEEIDATFTQIVLPESYYATPDELEAPLIFDPLIGRVETSQPTNQGYLSTLLG